MQNDCIEREERYIGSKDLRRETEQKDRQRRRESRHNVIERMQAHRREPVELTRGVMNCMEAPKLATMERAVAPVADEVAEDEHLQHLDPRRLPLRHASRIGGECLHVLAVEGNACGSGQEEHADHQGSARQSACHEGCKEPVRKIRREFAAQQPLATYGKELLEGPEYDAKQEEARDDRGELGQHESARG